MSGIDQTLSAIPLGKFSSESTGIDGRRLRGLFHRGLIRIVGEVITKKKNKINEYELTEKGKNRRGGIL